MSQNVATLWHLGSTNKRPLRRSLLKERLFRTCWFNVPSNLTIFKPAPPKGWTSWDSGIEYMDQLVPDHIVSWSARNLTHIKTIVSPQLHLAHLCWPSLLAITLSTGPARSAVHIIRQQLQLQYLRTNVLCLSWVCRMLLLSQFPLMRVHWDIPSPCYLPSSHLVSVLLWYPSQFWMGLKIYISCFHRLAKALTLSLLLLPG